MDKINFQDGVKVSSAKVTIDEVDYPVTPARYNGATPLSSTVMNTMQDNIEDAINQNADNIGGEDYDNTATYEVGDIVKYNGQLYICITAVTTAEDFDNTKWQATDVLSSAGGNEIAIGSASDITGKTKIFVEESTQRLKYKDSTTGNFTDIAGDEVFIGDEEDAPDSTKILVDTDFIKYKDTTTGDFEDIKVGDTLPIGAEVDYSGSTIPTGWEEVENEVVLYESTNGTKSAFQLSESIENYDYIEVFYKTGSLKGSKKIYNNKASSFSVSLSTLIPIWNATAPLYEMIIRSSTMSVSTNSCTFSSSSFDMHMTTNGITTNSTNSTYDIYVIKVVGYKED